MSDRPLSPHLQVYRLPLTAILSISHRITGVILSLGMIFWVFFLLAAAQGEAQFLAFRAVLESVPGLILLWLWLYALFFHLVHGVRHLICDTVRSLERATLTRYAYMEVGISAALTLVLLVFTLIRG